MTPSIDSTMSSRKRRISNDLSDDEYSPKSRSPSADEDKRNHHNLLERRRRDHIKDHFSALRASVPLLDGEKSSRALILKRAADYISLLQTQLRDAQTQVDDLRRRNDTLIQQAGIKPIIFPLTTTSTVPMFVPPSTSLFTPSSPTLPNGISAQSPDPPTTSLLSTLSSILRENVDSVNSTFPEIVDAQLLASSLALRERHFAAAAASHL